jgi:ABC-type transporter Mla maintaining outer membrane lipid asymmetry permease subunit MlaE
VCIGFILALQGASELRHFGALHYAFMPRLAVVPDKAFVITAKKLGFQALFRVIPSC